MPQFIPDHTPDPYSADAFTRGYLDCAEWLASSARDVEGTGEFEQEDRDSCKGWTQEAIEKAKADCADFQEANATLLVEYEETTGRDMESAGMDFFLTRNHHGAGFWDRGDAPCLQALTDAAHIYGDVLRGIL